MKSLLQRIKGAAQNLPISQKIVGIVMLSSLATLVALCSISFLREWRSFTERKAGELATLARILESNTVASLRFDDPYTAKEYVDSLRHETDIASVAIYDLNGDVFAHFARDQPEAPSAYPEFIGERWESNRLLYAHPIALAGQPIGKVLIAMDTASLQAAIQNSLWTSIALFAGGLILTFALATRLQRLIANPVNSLLSTTREVSASENYNLRAQKHYSDEIGLLVDSFNAMLETIRARDASLLEINSGLEKTVQQRTEDLRKRNAALKEAIEAASAASVAKSEFLASTSHELRTPLNPIIGYVEILLRRNPESADAHELNLIKQAAEHLLALIDEVLDLSRIERGIIHLQDAPVDFQRLCSDMTQLMEPQAKKRDLALSYQHLPLSLDRASPTVIMGDEGKLRQVLLNLIGNAIKFTHKGSVQLQSTLAQDEQSLKLRVQVTDTGIGISEKDQKKLFKAFTQIDGSYTREYGGMGLGLAISHRIVTAMGGTISCQSEKGKGSCFQFEIPVEMAAAETVDTPCSATELPIVSSGNVLLVEDEPINRELMRALLTSLGYSVILAVDGVEALEQSEGKQFELVLMDISMPRMNGYDAALALREREGRGRRTPIVAMTAHVSPENRERCFDVGMNDYLSKPISYSKLRSTLDKWILPVEKQAKRSAI